MIFILGSVPCKYSGNRQQHELSITASRVGQGTVCIELDTRMALSNMAVGINTESLVAYRSLPVGKHSDHDATYLTGS